MGVSFAAHGGYGIPVNLGDPVTGAPEKIQKAIWKRLSKRQRGYFADRKEFFDEDYYDSEMLMEAFPEISFIYIANPYVERRPSEKQDPDWLAVSARTEVSINGEAGSAPLGTEGFEPTVEELEAFRILKHFALPGARKPSWQIAFSIG